jgi:hypothetical protein
MKKLLVVVFCFISAGSFAQVRLGLQGGYSSSNFYSPGTDPNEISISHISSYVAGIVAEANLNKTFFVQSGLQWAGKGAVKNRGVFALYGANTTIRLNYLQLPLNLGVKFPLSKDVKVFAEGGIYAAVGISGTEKGSNVDQIAGTSTVERKVNFSNNPPAPVTTTYFKPFDAGYTVSAGIDWKLLQLSANFNKGFSNAIATGSTTCINQVFNVSLAYYLFEIK